MTLDFSARHIGPYGDEISHMLAAVGFDSLAALVDAVIPAGLRVSKPIDLPTPLSEREATAKLTELASKNRVTRSFLGQGYAGTLTPPVILRNILENPGWYTAYTPYQAEIAQGRLEALLLFQMLVQDLTGFEVSNASLLDEATAAAEAMAMCKRVATKLKSDTFFVDEAAHPQTIAVLQTRAAAFGWRLHLGDPDTFDPEAEPVFGAFVQSPTTDGLMRDIRNLAARCRVQGVPVVAGVDLLSLALFASPAEMGADIAIGSTQRFGVPMGYGGPHAAFLATQASLARKMPGRIIGVSRDAQGKTAYRMALQTREQHIRRAKATSNVCTAQVLLAVVAALYAVWHGPEGIRGIATRVHNHTATLAQALQAADFHIRHRKFFDTITVQAGPRAPAILEAAAALGIRLRDAGEGWIGISLDETVESADVADILSAFGVVTLAPVQGEIPAALARTSAYLTHPTFSRYHSETEMLRYIYRLQGRDLSLTTAMIPLGSCTMKLNATTEMAPITWPGFAHMHPFAPTEDAQGYRELLTQLSAWLSEITGFAACSLQPNAGSQGEYAGLLVIRAFHASQGQAHRTTCLIPTSAHGTNPASAAMAGFEIVEVACDAHGNVDVSDLEAKATAHADTLGALMITYPSTHGVFEEDIRKIIAIVHQYGGQVYLDGANLNALVGFVRPGDLGADVSHLNLHKTFCIPHGGGGPGMGPIAVAKHLAPFLPGHPLVQTGGGQATGPVSAAPFGSPSILPISWSYIAMMGAEGLSRATSMALLNANYIAARLKDAYPVLYTGKTGLVAHECILDCRAFKAVGIEVDDIAKRLMDHGFHGPTMSWPVAGTLMVEPTESESLYEIDRFCDAMLAIREEIRAVEDGAIAASDSPLHHAPHTAQVVIANDWSRAYDRESAAYPSAPTRLSKFWPAVSRVDNVFGDKHLQTFLPDDA